MGRLFGTDGIRGQANRHPITPEIALILGKSIAKTFESTGHGSKRALIGKDTRLSGYMLESALERSSEAQRPADRYRHTHRSLTPCLNRVQTSQCLQGFPSTILLEQKQED